MTHYVLYVTTADATEAERIGRTLVEERCVACVNILGPIRSIYWWEGAVRDSAEVLLVAKTDDGALDNAIARVRQLHSYQCPCVVAMPIARANPDFLSWISDSVGS